MSAETARWSRVARPTHPWAWWLWALLTAGAASLTTNPLVLVLFAAAAAVVVVTRRVDAPWARSVSAYFILACVIIGFRVVMMAVFGGQRTGTVLFTLPHIPLPAWAAGIRLGGPVTLNAVLSALYDGLRLATIIVLVGAANALSNPRKALRNVPAALNEISVAVVIALSVAPQLIESLHRVRRARRLRGGRDRGWAAVHGLLMPVLEDAVERSLTLATSMESRGYGRTRTRLRHRRLLSLLMLTSLMVLTCGIFLLLGVPQMKTPALTCLTIGVIAAVVGLRLSGRRLAVTRYRPERWRLADSVVGLCGAAAVTLTLLMQRLDPAALSPTTRPLVWPALPLPLLLAAACVLAPVVVTSSAQAQAATRGEVNAQTREARS